MAGDLRRRVHSRTPVAAVAILTVRPQPAFRPVGPGRRPARQAEVESIDARWKWKGEFEPIRVDDLDRIAQRLMDGSHVRDQASGPRAHDLVLVHNPILDLVAEDDLSS